MANYVAGLTNLASSGLSGNVSSGAISGVLPALTAVTSGGGGGSKPGALHTEYATGEANWEKPYGSSTDVVFYIVRADK